MSNKVANPDAYVDVVIAALSSIGISAKRIMCGSEKSPDVIAQDDTATYVIEVKVRLDDAKGKEDADEQLKRSGEFTLIRDAGYSHSVNAVIDNSAKQLSRYDPEHKYIHLVWFDVTGQDGQLNFLRIKNTLYGLVSVVDLQRMESRDAVFFDHSAIYRNKDAIDGVIITDADHGQFCINHLSKHRDWILGSKLKEAFKSAVYDPLALEESGHAFIVDGGFPRKIDYASIKYIQNKYGIIQLSAIRPKEFSTGVIIPKDT